MLKRAKKQEANLDNNAGSVSLKTDAWSTHDTNSPESLYELSGIISNILFTTPTSALVTEPKAPYMLDKPSAVLFNTELL